MSPAGFRICSRFRRRSLVLFLHVMLALSAASAGEQSFQRESLTWRNLPPLPRGISGHFAGVSNDVLITAGGAFFPTPLFEGGQKSWVDDIFVLRRGEDKWQGGFMLHRPLAYGAAITTEAGLICIGGSDAERNYAAVFQLTWANELIEQSTLPELPQPCALLSAAVLDDTIYVAGGQDSPNATAAMKNFWALTLSEPHLRWKVLEPWPGAARILPVAAAQDGAFYLISGCELLVGDDGKVSRRYLNDAYRFRPGRGWDRIASAPEAVAAAPAIAFGPSHILVFGGDDGKNADRVWELKENHPGFSRDILAYHTVTNTWTKMGTMPTGLVTTTAVHWEDGVIIPGGEDRPGHRSAEVLEGRPSEARAPFGVLNTLALLAYLCGLLMMGVYFSRREKSTADFFLAGRRVPWWAAGLSIFGTQLSAITFMAIPAKTYATNWVYFLGNMTIVLIAPVVVFLYLPFFRRLDITTAYEYLEKRFNLPVRLFGSTAFVLFQVGRMGIVLFLPALALSAVTGINIYTCILVMAVLCTIYTVLGGIEAVIWTDVLQVAVLLGGALISLFIIAGHVDGGFAGILAAGRASQKFRSFNWTWDATVAAVWVVLFGNLLGNLVPYTSDQTVIQRYLTTPDERQAARSVWTNAVLTIPASVIFFGMGTALFAFYKGRPDLLNPALQTDAIFPWFIVQQLPAGVSGLVIAGLFAAAMSTLDSSLNSVSTAIVTDFYHRLTPSAKDKTCLRMARVLTLVLGAVAAATACLMATYRIQSLWDVYLGMVGLLGGSLAGVFVLGIFTRRAHGLGAFVGAAISVVVLVLVQRFSPIHFLLYAPIAIVSCSLTGYAASCLIPSASKRLEGLTVYAMSTRKECRGPHPKAGETTGEA